VPLHLLAAEGDRTVAPSAADDVASRVPGATVDRLPGAGHLAHEEDADAVARWMARRA
jgi:magnesium chelatase accessory protein